MMKKQMLLLAFMLCGQLTLFSQYTITGIVKDENGNALVGANVLVMQTNYGSVSNLNGEYNLEGLKAGSYVLSVSYLGFETIQKEVLINGNVTLDFVLMPYSFIADEVIISAVRATGNMPVTKSVITREDIRKQNLGQDLPYLMALTPSIVTSSDAGAGIGYTNFRIRGTDLNRINVTVNGIPLNDAESHGVYWVDLPDIASSVENIQIQRGVGTSSQGGGAFGASINLQTLNLNKTPYAELSNATGSFNSFKHSVSFGTGLIKNHYTFDGRMSKISSDGFIDRAYSDLKSLYLSGAYYSENTLLKLVISSGFEETYQAWQGVPKVKLDNNIAGMLNYLAVQADWKEIDGNNDDSLNILNSDPRKYNMYRYKNQVDHYNQDHYQAIFSHSFSKYVGLNAALHYTRGKGYYEQYKPRQKFADYGLESVIVGEDTLIRTNLIRRKWLDNHFYGLTWSLNYAKNDLNLIFGGGWNKYDGDHYGKLRWAEFMSNGELDHQYYFNEGTKTDLNVFAKINYSITDELSVFGDLQTRRVKHSIEGLDDDYRDITQSHDYLFFNPKGGINFSLSDNHNFYGYVGVAHREPNRSNFVDADPLKPDPKAEQLIDYETGYNFKSVNAQVGINFYYMYYVNQLVLTGMINDVGAPVMTNVKSSYRSGVELTAGIKLIDQLIWNGNATFSKNIIKKFTEYIDNYDTWIQDEIYHKETNLAFSPNFIFGSQFSYSLNPFSISIISKYVGKQYIDNTASNLRKLDSYLVNDIRLLASFKVKSFCTMDAIFNINNVLNEEYETNAWIYQYNEGGENKSIDGYFPQAGRNYMVGLVLRF